MRICFVTTDYPPETHYGGIGSYTYTVSRAMVRRGHQVTVITATAGEPGYRRMQEGGVCVWRIYQPRLRRTLREHWRRNWQVWRAIEKIKPDLVQLVDFQAEGFLLSLMNRGRYKLVTRIADDAALIRKRSPFVGQKPVEVVRHLVLNYMARQQTLHSTVLFSPGRTWSGEIERYNGWAPGTVNHIYNGLDLAEMEAFRKTSSPLYVPGPYLIYFGRLEERKGVQYLAEAMPQVWEKFPSLRLVLAGRYRDSWLENKPARTYIEGFAGIHQANLIFTDQLTRDQLMPLVAQARLAVLPSIREMFGFSCAEALALGVPVITTSDSGGPAEIVGGLNDPEADPNSLPAGWLVPSRSGHMLAKAIIEALSDGPAMARARANARKRAKRFDLEHMADELEKLYQKAFEK